MPSRGGKLLAPPQEQRRPLLRQRYRQHGRLHPVPELLEEAVHLQLPPPHGPRGQLAGARHLRR